MILFAFSHRASDRSGDGWQPATATTAATKIRFAHVGTFASLLESRISAACLKLDRGMFLEIVGME